MKRMISADDNIDVGIITKYGAKVIHTIIAKTMREKRELTKIIFLSVWWDAIKVCLTL